MGMFTTPLITRSDVAGLLRILPGTSATYGMPHRRKTSFSRTKRLILTCLWRSDESRTVRTSRRWGLRRGNLGLGDGVISSQVGPFEGAATGSNAGSRHSGAWSDFTFARHWCYADSVGRHKTQDTRHKTQDTRHKTLVKLADVFCAPNGGHVE
jgi:hypothetical protein